MINFIYISIQINDIFLFLVSLICYFCKIKILIMKFDLKQLQAFFPKNEFFTTDAIFQFYNEKEPGIPRTTVNWRIYDLVHNGQLQRVGRGVYKIGQSNPFEPMLSNKIQKVAKHIQKEFSYINFFVWELSVINQFSQHLVNFDIRFVDVERDVVDAV
ncbi:MAG: hypothetical protein BGP01_06860 [Paludibacter sp. 47-17]|nr:MAG: hypothetical protein BGP01_06860 [Paludibacter sp. 47-17]